MNKVVLVLVALLVYEVSAVKLGWPTIQSHLHFAQEKKVANNSSAEILNACKMKTHCITAFVAPWCPVCKSSVSSFRLVEAYLKKYRKDVGLNIIVGAASAADNNKEAEHLQPLKVVADNDGEIMKAERIEAFPTWVVRDKAGREIFRKAGGLQIAQESQVEMLLRELIPENHL